MAGVRSAMRSPMRSALDQAMGTAYMSLANQALAVLRKFGSNAHVYMPGANGVAVSGLNTGNYTDQTLTTYASVDGTVGGIVDPLGAINATQPTGANRPSLRRGLYNRITYSNTFSDASWTKTSVGITATGIADPFGGSTAVTITASGASGQLLKLLAATSGVVHTSAIWIRRRTGSGTVYVVRGDGGSWIANAITSQWALYTDSYASTGSSGVGVQLDASGDAVDVCFAGSFQGTLTASDILREGGIPLTTSAAASNTVGRYSTYYSAGSQNLGFGNIPYQMNDDHCVIAGYRADVFQNTVVAPSHTSNTARYGSIGTSSGGNGIITEWYDGTQYVNHQTVVQRGSTNVTSATRASGVLKSRNNGVSFGNTAAFNTAVQGTVGSISATGALGPLTGSVGPVIVIKGTVSDADLLTLERWVASQTPAGPVF